MRKGEEDRNRLRMDWFALEMDVLESEGLVAVVVVEKRLEDAAL